MEDRAVRVMNTIVMGSTSHTLIPKVAQIISHTSKSLLKASNMKWLLKPERGCETMAEMAL